MTNPELVWVRTAAELRASDRRLGLAGVSAQLAASGALLLWSVPHLPGSGGWQALLLAAALAIGARATGVAAGARVWGDSWPVVQVCAVALVAVAGLVPGAAAGPVASAPAYVLLVAATAAHLPPSSSAALVSGCAAGQLAAVTLAGAALGAWLLQAVATGLVAVLLGTLRSSRALLAEIVERELTDPVTRLPGRRYLHQLLDAEVAAARPDAPLAVLAVHVDDLGEIDREQGASVGDEVLAGLAARLGASLPAGVVLARAGDDLLAVLAPRTDAAMAWQLAEDMRRAAACAGEGLPDVAVRVGVVVVPDAGEREAAALLELAGRVAAPA